MKKTWLWSTAALLLTACTGDTTKTAADVCSGWSSRLTSNLKKAHADNNLFTPADKIGYRQGAVCNRSSLEQACRSVLLNVKTQLGQHMTQHCSNFAEEFVNACGINPKEKLLQQMRQFVHHTFEKTCLMKSEQQVGFAPAIHTVCVSNFSGIQNNAFEFAGMQKGTELENQNEQILAAADQAMQQSTDTLETVINAQQKDAIFALAQSVYNKTGQSALANKQEFDQWYNNNKTKTASQLFKDAKGRWITPGGPLDKRMRQANQSRPSITQNYRVQQQDIDKLTNAWIRVSQTSLVNAIAWKTNDKDITADMPSQLMQLCFFDVLLSHKMAASNLLQDLHNIQDGFYKGVLGELEKKAQHMAKLYARATVMGVQESNLLLDKQMQQQGFFSVDIAADQSESDFQGKSRLYFRQDIWDSSTTKKVPHTLQGTNKKGKQAAIGNELALVLAVEKATGHKVLFAAAHSGSSGSDSIEILQGIRNIANAQQSQNVVVLHDANTNQDTNDNSKLDLQTYLKAAATNNLTPAFGSYTPDTVDKARTFAQLQLKKAGNRARGTSDHILISNNATIQLLRSNMISPGPDNVNPTDHGVECEDIQLQ
ncbi:MAG: hypothetical protein AAF320_03460 [Myxococcota bacterium]